MAQKRPKLVQNMHFWSFWAKYCHSLHILSNARPKNNVNKVPRWVFRYVGNKTFDFSSKKRNFSPKTTKFGPKLAFLVNLGQAMQAYSMPCCGLVGGCGARAVSRKTPIYFIRITIYLDPHAHCPVFFAGNSGINLGEFLPLLSE